MINVTPTSMPTNSGLYAGSVPDDSGAGFCRGERTRHAQDEHDRQEPAEAHRQAERRVVPGRVHRNAGERGTVVVSGRRERIQHFGQTVCARIEHRRSFLRERHRRRRADEHDRGGGEEIQRRELDLPAADLLA